LRLRRRPASVADDTPSGDILAKAASFSRSVRAADRSPMTIKSYLGARTGWACSDICGSSAVKR
jgi:hypothetical protein